MMYRSDAPYSRMIDEVSRDALEHVTEYMGTKVVDIIGPDQREHHTMIRCMVVAVMKELYRMIHTDIAVAIQRERSSVSYYYTKHNDNMQVSALYRKAYTDIIDDVKRGQIFNKVFTVENRND